MLIAIEGCIGVGKTTVAEGLAAHRRSETLFESFNSNPFLENFYKSPAAFATETEFTFLLLHFSQLKNCIKSTANGELITDFYIGKDLIFADLNLHESRIKKVFMDLYGIFQEQLPMPNLLICLSASTDLLLERIRKRQRDIELKIDPSYYEKLNTDYEQFFATYQGKKLTISMNEWDFVKNISLFETLSQLVDKTLKTP